MKKVLILLILLSPTLAFAHPPGSPVAAGGSGDVVGPGSATDGTTTCFDGVTGKLLKECTVDPATSSANITDNAVVRGDGGAKGVQESLVLIDDTGYLTVPDSWRFYNTTGTRIFHNYVDPTGGGAVPDGFNIFMGEGAGNFTVGSTATQIYHGSYNIGIGATALDTTSTGYYNIGIGQNALTAITTGFRNLALGHYALDAMDTGNDNLAIGYNALTAVNSNTDLNVAVGNYALENAGNASDRNTALGYGAGRNITTSSDYNVFLGASAGANASGPVDLTGISNSVFIGRNSQALNATGDTNEVVIGYEAIGHGSDTVTIGGANMASHYLFSDLDLATGDERSLTIYGEWDKATSGDVYGIFGSWKDTSTPDNAYFFDFGTNSATDGGIGTHTSKIRGDVDGNIILDTGRLYFDTNLYAEIYATAAETLINSNKATTITHTSDIDTAFGLTDGQILFVSTSAANDELDGTNVRQAGAFIAPTFAQSATAAYDGVLVAVYPESSGDGSAGDGNNLINAGTATGDWGAGFSSKFRVDNNGNTRATGTQEHGEMAITSTDTLTINQANQLHAMDGFSTGLVADFTFDAGGVGSGNITTSGGGAAININDVGHGLVDGDYVTVTSANHEGVSAVTYVDADNFTLAIAYVGDEACQWQQGSSLTATNTGRYDVTFKVAGNGAAASKDFYWAVYKNATLQTKCQDIRSTSTAYGSMSISCFADVTAADVLFLVMENRTDANNWNTEFANFNVKKL